MKRLDEHFGGRFALSRRRSAVRRHGPGTAADGMKNDGWILEDSWSGNRSWHPTQSEAYNAAMSRTVDEGSLVQRRGPVDVSWFELDRIVDGCRNSPQARFRHGIEVRGRTAEGYDDPRCVLGSFANDPDTLSDRVSTTIEHINALWTTGPNPIVDWLSDQVAKQSDRQNNQRS